MSTNSHTSEVRVVGNIMFHCRDNTAEQLLREVLGRGGGSLDTLDTNKWLVIVSSPSPGELGLFLQVLCVHALYPTHSAHRNPYSVLGCTL